MKRRRVNCKTVWPGGLATAEKGQDLPTGIYFTKEDGVIIAIVVGSVAGVITAALVMHSAAWIIAAIYRPLHEREAKRLRAKYGPFAITELSQ